MQQRDERNDDVGDMREHDVPRGSGRTFEQTLRRCAQKCTWLRAADGMPNRANIEPAHRRIAPAMTAQPPATPHTLPTMQANPM